MSAHLLLLHCLSPLHAGIGQGIGAVDLSIARERNTGFPYLPGSSLKGSLRAASLQNDEDATYRIFGPDTDNAADHAGAIAFGDANLLFLPVRSVRGTFAYVTSPYLLSRFLRDLDLVQHEHNIGKPPTIKDMSVAVVDKDSYLTQDKKVYFEDLDFSATESSSDFAKNLAKILFKDDELQKMFQRRFCVVHDDAMSFLSRHATDVVTRIALEPGTKTVAKGALWTEENLPSETILSSLIVPTSYNTKSSSHTDNIKALEDIVANELRLGGKETVGRGRCAARLYGGDQ